MTSRHPRSATRQAPAETPATGPLAECRRCHEQRAVDEDGFCDACRKALEEACL